MLYLWLKAAHVASVLIFIGGLMAQTLAVATLWEGASNLHRAIERWDQRVTTPAMLSTWLFGILLAVKGAFFTSGWLAVKLAIVVFLSGMHGIQSGRLRRALRDRSVRAKRIYLSTPAIVAFGALAIAVLAVIKPF
ncbi:CopD family protein [Sphingomonadaceae bacterium jetA1]|jgi:uncharacterized membrane protein|uniref:CopD family protein n=1 Tax=Facivitalis istanbulensis TaxID=3075838 RepID=UPI00346E564D